MATPNTPQPNASPQEQVLCQVTTVYNEAAYIQMVHHSLQKLRTTHILGLSAAAIFLLAALTSLITHVHGALPLALIGAMLAVAFGVRLCTLGRLKRKTVQDRLTLTGELTARFTFYPTKLCLETKSNNTFATYTKSYAEIAADCDKTNLYLTFNNMLCCIPIYELGENLEMVVKLVNLKLPDTTNKHVRRTLLSFFILSFLALFLALIALAISMLVSNSNNLPQFMWWFFVFASLPLTSTVLGFVYSRKEYRCKRNIIAGIIMFVIMCIYGCFCFIF